MKTTRWVGLAWVVGLVAAAACSSSSSGGGGGGTGGDGGGGSSSGSDAAASSSSGSGSGSSSSGGHDGGTSSSSSSSSGGSDGGSTSSSSGGDGGSSSSSGGDGGSSGSSSSGGDGGGLAVKVVANVTFPGTLTGAAFDPTAGLLWVGTSAGLVSVDQTYKASAPVTQSAEGDIAVLPQLNKVYSSQGSSIEVVDGASRTVKTTIPVTTNGQLVEYIVADANTNRVFALTDSTFSASNFVVIDGTTDTVSTSVPTGLSVCNCGENKTLSVDAKNGKVWALGGYNGKPVTAVALDEGTMTTTSTTVSSTSGDAAYAITAISATGNAVALVRSLPADSVAAYLVDPTKLNVPLIVPRAVMEMNGNLYFSGDFGAAGVHMVELDTSGNELGSADESDPEAVAGFIRSLDVPTWIGTMFGIDEPNDLASPPPQPATNGAVFSVK